MEYIYGGNPFDEYLSEGFTQEQCDQLFENVLVTLQQMEYEITLVSESETEAYVNVHFTRYVDFDKELQEEDMYEYLDMYMQETGKDYSDIQAMGNDFVVEIVAFIFEKGYMMTDMDTTITVRLIPHAELGWVADDNTLAWATDPEGYAGETPLPQSSVEPSSTPSEEPTDPGTPTDPGAGTPSIDPNGGNTAPTPDDSNHVTRGTCPTRFRVLLKNVGINCPLWTQKLYSIYEYFGLRNATQPIIKYSVVGDCVTNPGGSLFCGIEISDRIEY